MNHAVTSRVSDAYIHDVISSSAFPGPCCSLITLLINRYLRSGLARIALGNTGVRGAAPSENLAPGHRDCTGTVLETPVGAAYCITYMNADRITPALM